MLPILVLIVLAPSLAPPTVQDPPQSGAPEHEKEQAPEIIVTGTLEDTGVPVVPLNATGSRDVLGPDEVQRTGAREMNDLIQYLPAVSTRPYNGGESSAPSFSMRGLPDDGLTEYILVAIDGVPASPMPYGWTAFSFFPLLTEQVYAIDLIRGGYSVRYSPNTVGGVLNLITPPIPGDETYELRSTYGSNDYFATLLSAGDDDGRFGYLVTLGEKRGDGYRDDSDFLYRTFDAKTRWTFAEGDWLSLRTSYVENEHRPPGGLTQAQFAQNPFGNARPNNRFDGFRAVADVVRHVESDDGYLEWYGWASQTRRKLQGDRPSFGPVTEHRVVDDDAYAAAIGARAQSAADLLGMEHTLYYGVRVAEEVLPNRVTESTPIPPGPTTKLQDAQYELTSISAHVDDTLHPSERWTVVAGARAEWIPIAKGEDDVAGGDFYDQFFDVLPGVSTSYQVTDGVALFANYQESFRSPQVWGFDVTVASPDQDLSFEHGSSYELGLRSEFDAGLSGSIAAWHTDFDDVGVFGTTGVYQTIGNVEADGIDYVLRWEAGKAVKPLDGFSVYASYTTQDSELVAAANPAFDGNETPYAWEQKLAWSFQYERGPWRTALGGVYVGESFSDEANTVAENANGNLGLNESRTIWDAQVSREIELGEKCSGRLSLGATNVFDEEWSVHSRGGFFGGGKVAGPPRQVYFGLQVSF
jgi:Fe(3+) dicitrate transport protein